MPAHSANVISLVSPLSLRPISSFGSASLLSGCFISTEISLFASTLIVIVEGALASGTPSESFTVKGTPTPSTLPSDSESACLSFASWSFSGGSDSISSPYFPIVARLGFPPSYATLHVPEQSAYGNPLPSSNCLYPSSYVPKPWGPRTGTVPTSSLEMLTEGPLACVNGSPAPFAGVACHAARTVSLASPAESYTSISFFTIGVSICSSRMLVIMLESPSAMPFWTLFCEHKTNGSSEFIVLSPDWPSILKYIMHCSAALHDSSPKPLPPIASKSMGLNPVWLPDCSACTLFWSELICDKSRSMSLAYSSRVMSAWVAGLRCCLVRSRNCASFCLTSREYAASWLSEQNSLEQSGLESSMPATTPIGAYLDSCESASGGAMFFWVTLSVACEESILAVQESVVKSVSLLSPAAIASPFMVTVLPSSP